MIKPFDARAWKIVAEIVLGCALGMASPALDVPRTPNPSPLDKSFAGLYNLDFAGAQTYLPPGRKITRMTRWVL